MAELSVADSSAGPLMICMRADFLPAGRCSEAVWTEKITMLTETAITNRRSLLMCRPHGCFTLQKTHRRRGATAKCHLSSGSFHLLAKWTSQRFSQICNILLEIKAATQKIRFFFPIGRPDGSVSWVNLWQATEIHRISEDECHIKLADGQVVAVSRSEERRVG